MSYPAIPINSIVSGYQEAMDWIARATSRNITVIVHPMKSGCPNGSGFDPINKREYPVYNTGNPFSTTTPTIIPSFGISGILNVPFSGGQACPICNGDGFIYSPTSGTVSARIQFRNEGTTHDVSREKLVKEEFRVRIKVTGDAAIDLLDRAERVIIDGENCRIERQKVPVGLRDVHSYYYYLDKVQ